jgi:predicted permease
MVVQIALSLVLLVAAGLFVRTLNELQGVDAGFDRRQLLLFGIDARSAGYPRDEFTALHARIQERLERIPGVRGATFSRVAVLSRVRQTNTVAVPGVAPPPGAQAGVHMNGVAANFFTTMALPIVLGRGFAERDNAGGPNVGVINQSLAARYFGTENPIGRQIAYRTGPLADTAVQIVGVAADAKYTDLRSPAPPTLYLPALQQIGASANFAVRFDMPAGNGASAHAPGALVAAVRAAVRGVDPSLPLLDLRTQDEQLDRLHSQPLLFARLSGMFGALALALACVGLYGLMSYAVGQRTSEIGLRMALGAPRTHVLRLVLRESFVLVALGVGVGLALAGASSRLIANMLFGVSPADPTSYGVVAVMLTGVALVASLVPARRAIRIDPMSALRAE